MGIFGVFRRGVGLAKNGVGKTTLKSNDAKNIQNFKNYMCEMINSVSGEEQVAATTTEDLKADILSRVESMFDYVKDVRDDLKIKRFYLFLDDMMEIAREIEEKGHMKDEQMYDIWSLITMFNDEVENDMPICRAREYLEMRLSSIIKVLQGEKIFFRKNGNPVSFICEYLEG